ncbi:hypothetical protein C8R31_101699 [Nitrosospira sp. Nsp2]|nr:hypothetical protein C8R31_101699 [Nitrosospira sp. Nsp2]
MQPYAPKTCNQACSELIQKGESQVWGKTVIRHSAVLKSMSGQLPDLG